MVAVTYDFIKKLEHAGFTSAQVEVLSTFTTETVNKPEMMQIEKDLSDKIDASEIKLEVKVDKSVGDLDARVDQLETKTDKLEKTMNLRFDKVDARFDKVDARFDKIDARFEKIDARFEKVDARFEKLEEKMDRKFDGIYSLIKWMIGILITLIPAVPGFTIWFSHIAS